MTAMIDVKTIFSEFSNTTLFFSLLNLVPMANWAISPPHGLDYSLDSDGTQMLHMMIFTQIIC